MSSREIPETVIKEISEAVPGSKILLAAKSDLAADGRFGERWVVLAGEHVLVVTPDSTTARVEIDLPLKEISEVQVENLIGGGMLQALVNGRTVDLLPYTNALAKRFGVVRRQLEAAVKREPLPDEPEQEYHCPSCGLVLGEDTRVCPRCVDKTATLRRLLRYVRPYRGPFVLASVLMLIGTALGLLPPYLTKILIDKVLIPRGNGHLLAWLVATLGASSLLGGILSIWRIRLSAYLTNRISFDIRAQLYDHLQWLSMRYFDRHPTGGIISRLVQDASGVRDFLGSCITLLFINIVTILGIAIAVFVINWKLALLAVLPVPLTTFLSRMLRLRLRQAFRQFWQQWGRFNAFVSDTFPRIKIVKAFSQQCAESKRFLACNTDVLDTSMRVDQTCGIITALMGLLLGCGSLLGWYFGGQAVLRNSGFTVGDLMAFLGYLGMLYGPIHYFSAHFQDVYRALTAAERVFEVLDAEADSERTGGSILPEQILGEVEFRNVTFGYHRHQPVLKNVSFKVRPGQMLGLVGKSGVGKTTVINLICRFYDPDEGEIFIDGIRLRDIDLAAYRRRLGVVLQEPFLMNGSIAENIAYGKPGASIEEIMAAARVANAHDFIINKPDGYDEQVGESGSRLSAGERQRICIARAILHDPAILILDEATANVDLETESQIQEAIARLIQQRTTFAIAHRLSTLRNAHNLLVLEDGRIAEVGTHEELRENKGVYHRLLDIYHRTSAIRAVDG